ncbi:uncharacterized protein LOC142355290 isoform X2 [Convolutriloba macropyga]|uniref:uncharacterized protein LOC142355290 isoform X2 n=1 Tax=Convolutriloba macropyga TaxID=536237 RepID=UPI003F523C10
MLVQRRCSSTLSNNPPPHPWNNEHDLSLLAANESNNVKANAPSRGSDSGRGVSPHGMGDPSTKCSATPRQQKRQQEERRKELKRQQKQEQEQAQGKMGRERGRGRSGSVSPSANIYGAENVRQQNVRQGKSPLSKKSTECGPGGVGSPERRGRDPSSEVQQQQSDSYPSYGSLRSQASKEKETRRSRKATKTDAGIYHRRSSSAMSFGSLKSQVNSNFSADYKARATTKDGRSDHTDLERRRLRKVPAKQEKPKRIYGQTLSDVEERKRVHEQDMRQIHGRSRKDLRKHRIKQSVERLYSGTSQQRKPQAVGGRGFSSTSSRSRSTSSIRSSHQNFKTSGVSSSGGTTTVGDPRSSRRKPRQPNLNWWELDPQTIRYRRIHYDNMRGFRRGKFGQSSEQGFLSIQHPRHKIPPMVGLRKAKSADSSDEFRRQMNEQRAAKVFKEDTKPNKDLKNKRRSMSESRIDFELRRFNDFDRPTLDNRYINVDDVYINLKINKLEQQLKIERKELKRLQKLMKDQNEKEHQYSQASSAKSPRKEKTNKKLLQQIEQIENSIESKERQRKKNKDKLEKAERTRSQNRSRSRSPTDRSRSKSRDKREKRSKSRDSTRSPTGSQQKGHVRFKNESPKQTQSKKGGHSGGSRNRSLDSDRLIYDINRIKEIDDMLKMTKAYLESSMSGQSQTSKASQKSFSSSGKHL